MRYDRRLHTLSRRLGLRCPRHEERLTCPMCDVPPPLPADLSAMQDVIIDTILTRIGREALRVVCRRVPRAPAFNACARCGTARQCVACGADYGRALLQAIGLTATEQAIVARALAECRARDGKWRR
jgi:hypothetical protein